MNGPLLDTLVAVLRPEVAVRRVVDLIDADSKQTVKLRRDDSDLDVVTVRPQDLGTLLPFPFFNPHVKGLSRCCDYLLFCQLHPAQAGPLFVLLVEMKRTRIGGSRRQIENGCLLARYLLAAARHHNPATARPPRSMYFRGLVLTDNRDVPKPSTGGRPRCRYQDPFPGGFPRLRVADLPPTPNGYAVPFFCDDQPADDWPLSF